MKRAPVIELPVAQIRLDGGTQPRAALDFGAIDDYADAMTDGAKFPPLVVFYDGENYWLADGFHRVKAAWQASRETVAAEVRLGTLEDARWYSFSANRANGLRRTNEDKQRAVKAALLHPKSAGLSNRAIARHVGVDEGTVRNWREKLAADAEIPQRERTAHRGRRAPKSSAPAPPTAIRRPFPDDRFQPVLEAMKQFRDCHAAAAELAAWITTQPQQFELIRLLEEIHALINEVLARAGQATACA
jgi:transposase-like protein